MADVHTLPGRSNATLLTPSGQEPELGTTAWPTGVYLFYLANGTMGSNESLMSDPRKADPHGAAR